MVAMIKRSTLFFMTVESTVYSKSFSTGRTRSRVRYFRHDVQMFFNLTPLRSYTLLKTPKGKLKIETNFAESAALFVVSSRQVQACLLRQQRMLT